MQVIALNKTPGSPTRSHSPLIPAKHSNVKSAAALTPTKPAATVTALSGTATPSPIATQSPKSRLAATKLHGGDNAEEASSPLGSNANATDSGARRLSLSSTNSGPFASRNSGRNGKASGTSVRRPSPPPALLIESTVTSNDNNKNCGGPSATAHGGKVVGSAPAALTGFQNLAVGARVTRAGLAATAEPLTHSPGAASRSASLLVGGNAAFGAYVGTSGSTSQQLPRAIGGSVGQSPTTGPAGASNAGAKRPSTNALAPASPASATMRRGPNSPAASSARGGGLLLALSLGGAQSARVRSGLLVAKRALAAQRAYSEALVLHQQQAAAVAVQRWWRRWRAVRQRRAKVRARRLLHTAVHGVVTRYVVRLRVRRAARRRAAAEAEALQRRWIAAARTMQRVVRAWLGRLRRTRLALARIDALRAIRLAEQFSYAVVLAQCMWRRRTVAMRLRLKRSAARHHKEALVAGAVRNYLARRHAKGIALAVCEAEFSAANDIQRVFRGHRARCARHQLIFLRRNNLAGARFVGPL